MSAPVPRIMYSGSIEGRRRSSPRASQQLPEHLPSAPIAILRVSGYAQERLRALLLHTASAF